MDDDILLNIKDRVATVTFNRPTQRNAISYEGWLKLQDILTKLENQKEVTIVVLTGAGKEAFSAGADIKDFEKHRQNSHDAKIYASAFDGAMDTLEAMSKPTICLIKGFCIGGGCELSMAADIRITSSTGKFGIPVAKLGILVGYREMSRLVNLVGPGNASFMLMSGKLFDAEDALRMGLVNQVVALSDVDEYVYKLAHDMAPLAPLSQSRHKQIMQIVLKNPSLQNLSDQENELPFTNFDSKDFHEGRQAFIERRKPFFTGE